jgi:amidophosphoribosyltransferase
MFDKFNDECGLVSLWNVPEAANLAYLGLYAQQHRGQEGAGVVSMSSDAEQLFHRHRGSGLVADVFLDYDFAHLPGSYAVGHVRYTTAGGSDPRNIQPFFAELSIGQVALAHNGNLVNADELRERLIAQGAIFSSTSDTEIFMHLLARAPRNGPLVESLIWALKQVQGAYSLLILFGDRMFAVRDPQGVRPLVIGAHGGGLTFASETCAFDLIGASYVRDVEPGEIVEVTEEARIRSYFPFGYTKPSPCVFEYVYFARPDSNVFGRNVYPIRKRMGAELAVDSPVDADIVVPVPDSGVPAALGYAEKSGIPLEFGLIRNHYVGRTFIEPKQSIRDFGVKIKLNANPETLRGKRVIVVDDSIVRGTTSRKIVKMLREAGASEVHMRVSAPPTVSPCFYGIDTPDKEELIAARMTVEEISRFIGVDTLSYLSLDGLYRAVQGQREKFCDACFTNEYPIPIPTKKNRQSVLFP